MRRAFAALLAVLAIACTAEAEPAADFPHFTTEGGRVRDGADILSPEAEADLTAKLDQAEEDYGPQMAIVTVPTLEGYSIEDFSLAYANAWGLGDAARDDGLMIFVAPNEKSVRIEVGLGLEDTFTDAYCQQVIDNVLLPAFRRGEFETGLQSATQVLVGRMRQSPTVPANDNGPESEMENAA